MAIKRCLDTIKAAPVPEGISDTVWVGSCHFNDLGQFSAQGTGEIVRLIQALIQHAQQTRYARQMRQTLGVSVDDRQAIHVTERECPEL